LTRRPGTALLLTLLLLFVSVGPAVAQSNETAANESAPSVDERVDSQVWISDWSHDGGNFTVTLYSEVPTRVMLVEVVDAESVESGKLSVRQVAVDGRQTVTIEADKQVIVYTSRSLDAGSLAYLDAGDNSEPLIGGPWRPSDLWIVGSLSAILGVVSVPLVKRLIENRIQSDRIL